jgi:DNA mismatch endonuclease (patch repair protein)
MRATPATKRCSSEPLLSLQVVFASEFPGRAIANRAKLPESAWMVDHVEATRRSAIMARVRSRDTGPELIVRRALHALGFRFRLHRRDLPGRPDIVLPRFKMAIFVHGCFWHCHPGCAKAGEPKSRTGYWREKLAGNVERDARVQRELCESGWRVKTVWQCETKDGVQLLARLKELLQPAHQS